VLYTEELLLPTSSSSFPMYPSSASRGTPRREPVLLGLKVIITTIGIQNVEEYLSPEKGKFTQHYENRG
jgi:hypothetical protein